MKYFAIIATLSFSSLLVGSVQAQSNVPVFTPEAYRGVVTVPKIPVSVPTVVEVPLTSVQVAQPSFGVIEDSTQLQIPYYWRSARAVLPLKTTVAVDGSGPLRSLVDGNITTSELFPLPDSGAGVVLLNLETEKVAALSSLTFLFQKNVTLPLSVSIEMVTPEGKIERVLAETLMQSNTVLFPVVSTANLQVTLTYDQPLRIGEITLGEESQAVKETAGLRFLAQPNESYTIYLNPDRPVVGARGEAGDLTRSDGVIMLAAGIVRTNSQYQPNDSDSDGVAETLDNCRTISNPQQSDINNNGIGDECDDYDRDDVINSIDNCPDAPNGNQTDEDADGIGDVCDNEESRLTEKYTWILWAGLALGFITLGTLFAIVLRRDPNINV